MVYTVAVFHRLSSLEGTMTRLTMLLHPVAIYLILTTNLYAGDGCVYKQPPQFNDQDIHISDGVCQRCENGIWVDRYCSVCTQAKQSRPAANKSGKKSKAGTCSDGNNTYTEGARKGGPGSRQVCAQGAWANTEPDTNTVCAASAAPSK
jgi:hypothetical protein